MSIGKLPTDVMAHIAGYITDDNLQKSLKFGEHLSLLAINQQWRNTTLPIVYMHLYLNYGRIDLLRLTRRDMAGEPKEPDNEPVKSNIDLTASLGHLDLVRQVDIKLNCVLQPFVGLEQILRLLASYRIKWSMVTTLNISITINKTVSVWRNIKLEEHQSMLTSVSNQLRSMFPNISKMHLSGSERHPIIIELSCKLACSYANQLRKLKSSFAITLPRGTVLAKPLYVSIESENTRVYRVPAICPTNLVYLYLHANFENYDWSPFLCANDDCAELPNLKYLNIIFRAIDRAYSGNAGQFGYQCRGHLPSLRVLNITSMTSQCRFFELTRLPEQMDSVSINAPVAVIESFKNNGVPKVSKLTIDVRRNDRNSTAELMKAINPIFKSVGKDVHSFLSLEGSGLTLDPALISFTSMEELYIDTVVGIQAAIGIIRALPRLKGISLKQIAFEATPEFVTLADALDKDKPVLLPFSSDITYLDIGYDSILAYSTNRLSVLFYFLLKLPKLKLLFSRAKPDELSIFIRRLLPRYPHLKNVCFN